MALKKVIKVYKKPTIKTQAECIRSIKNIINTSSKKTVKERNELIKTLEKNGYKKGTLKEILLKTAEKENIKHENENFKIIKTAIGIGFDAYTIYKLEILGSKDITKRALYDYLINHKKSPIYKKFIEDIFADRIK